MVAKRRIKNKRSVARQLTVSEAAQLLDVTPATLRNWDKTGKLKPRRHPINGYRLYDSTDVEALQHAIRHGSPKKARAR